MNDVFSFSFRSNEGQEQSLEQYRGKVMLLVNTASKCGFTPQYEGLEKLHQSYKDQGLVVIGFPCDQFGHQEPGSNADIQQFCQLNYGVTFTLSEKIEVNGDQALPLFKFLKSSQKGVLGTEGIKWNFTKFLVDREGKVVERYASTTKPSDIEKDIERLL